MVRGFALAAGLVVLGASGTAGAQSNRPGLNWVRLPGAEQCIGWRELGRRVERKLQRTLFEGPSTADLSLDGHVAPQPGGGFIAHLAVTDAQGNVLGQRTLGTHEDSCRALDDAIILVIAVTVDPDSQLLDVGIPLSPEVAGRLDRLFRDDSGELEATSVAPAATDQGAHGRAPDATLLAAAEAPLRGPNDPGTAPESVPDKQRVWHWTFGVLGLAEAGMLPGVAPGLAAHVWWHPAGPWALELQGHWVAPRYVAAPGAEPGRVRAQLAGAGLAACLGMRLLGPSRGWLCSGGRVDSVSVEPEGFATDWGTRSDPWVSAQLGGIVQLPWAGALFAELGLHLVVPIAVHNYEVLDSAGAKHRLLGAGRVAGRLEVGVGFRP